MRPALMLRLSRSEAESAGGAAQLQRASINQRINKMNEPLSTWLMDPMNPIRRHPTDYLRQVSRAPTILLLWLFLRFLKRSKDQPSVIHPIYFTLILLRNPVSSQQRHRKHQRLPPLPFFKKFCITTVPSPSLTIDHTFIF
jgi:hypothetical protein